jgi:hypothetical protein
LLSHSNAALLPDFASVPKDLPSGPVIGVTAQTKKETAMKQSHHVPPHPTRISVVAPTLRSMPFTIRWRLTNLLTLGAAVLAVALSVSLSSAETNEVCALPLDRVQTAACE